MPKARALKIISSSHLAKPLDGSLFAHNARAWLAVLGTRAAQRAISLPYSARYAYCHAAAFWPNASEWEAAVDSAGRFDALTGRLADASLNMLLVKFNASFDGSGDTSDLAWFPAWALVEKPVSRDGSPGRNPRDTSRPNGRCASSSICSTSSVKDVITTRLNVVARQPLAVRVGLSHT
jgi:hypothetical protein